jgi:hypothetical protein
MKRCYVCKELKELSHFAKDRTRPDGLTNRCRPCDAKKAEARLKRVRGPIWDLVGQCKESGCIKCGEKDPCTLDFHHLRDKHFNISQALRVIKNPSTFSIADVEEEIKKCVVLCANCHRKLHSARFLL